MNISKQQLLCGIGLLLFGLLLGWLLFSGSENSHNGTQALNEVEFEQHVEDAHTDEDGRIIYTCSMHPSVRQGEQGNCPICGMELILARSQNTEALESETSMVLTASTVRLANIQTVPVQRRVPEKILDLSGRVQIDERKLTSVTTHFSGRIRDLKIDFTGAPIRKGEVMASIYSPELIVAQRELLEATQKKERNPRLYESVRQKFRLWGFSDEQINEIEDRGYVQDELDILSPVNGFVMSRNVVEEQHVLEGTVIFEVANLDRVWIVLEAYEEDLTWISEGDTFDFQTRANHGETFEAIVSFIDPVVDVRSRTVRVRADLNNNNGLLKPNMLVRARLNSQLQDKKLLVPSSSVLWTGKRSLVYVKDSSGKVPKFEAKLVELGPRTGDFYVIEDGLKEGQEVVFHGVFRLDSEMQLADKFSMMNREAGSGGMPGHDHGGMDMNDQDLSSIGINEDKQSDFFDDSKKFRAKFTEIIEVYIRGKNAFFDSDFGAVKSEYQTFINELEKIGPHAVAGEGNVAWMKSYGVFTESALRIVAANDLMNARSAFKKLSDELIMTVEMFELDRVVYKQYCPMEDKSWLSDEKQIKNPYTPDTMPGCGEVTEMIGL